MSTAALRADEDDAYLDVWLHHDGFDTSWSDELIALLAPLARPIAR